MSHRTGLPNWRDGDSLPIYFTPGERFSDSGEGYIYLERVVEQITGKPLNTFVTETAFEPLGMSRSSYLWRSDFDALTATGHDVSGKTTPVEKPKEAGSGFNLEHDGNDYALFVDAVLNRKRLKPGTLREMENAMERVACWVRLSKSCLMIFRTQLWDPRHRLVRVGREIPSKYKRNEEETRNERAAAGERQLHPSGQNAWPTSEQSAPPDEDVGIEVDH